MFGQSITWLVSLETRLSNIEKRLDAIDKKLESIETKMSAQIKSNLQWGFLGASVSALGVLVALGFELPERNIILFIVVFSFIASFLVRLFSIRVLLSTIVIAGGIEVVLIFSLSQIAELEQAFLAFILLGLFLSVLVLWWTTLFIMRMAKGMLDKTAVCK